MLGTEKEKDFMFNLNPQGLSLKKTEQGSFMLTIYGVNLILSKWNFITFQPVISEKVLLVLFNLPLIQNNVQGESCLGANQPHSSTRRETPSIQIQHPSVVSFLSKGDYPSRPWFKNAFFIWMCFNIYIVFLVSFVYSFILPQQVS